MRNLDQDACAIAKERVSAHGAAMVEVHEDLKALRHDGIGLLALHVGDEADATGVVLIPGIVETLCGGKTHFHARKLVQSSVRLSAYQLGTEFQWNSPTCGKICGKLGLNWLYKHCLCLGKRLSTSPPRAGTMPSRTSSGAINCCKEA